MENFILKSEFYNQSVVRIPDSELDAALLNGGNQKKILIVCQAPDDNLNVDEVFLSKIFESVHVDIQQDATLLLLPQNKDFSWKSITKAIDFKTLVFFGTDLTKIGLQLAAPSYSPFEFQERLLLATESLNAIAIDKAKKAALWNALKSLFPVA
jgi:hypothetical protein